MRVFLFVHFAVCLFLSPVFAEIDVAVVSESIVQVRVYKNHKILAEGSGFVVNEEGYVLTNAHLLTDAEGLTVLSRKTGAEIVSQQIFTNRELNLALLRVQGLDLPPLNLSEQGAVVGRVVETLKLTPQDSIQIARGTIGAYQDVPGKKVSDPVVHLLQHNAMVTSRAFGMPLFNECGDVVAINLPDLESGSWPFRKVEPREAIFALRSGDIITVLKDRKIAHTVVEEECLSAVERAQRDRKIAEDSIKAVAQAARDSVSAERVARLAAEKAVREKQQEAENAKAARLAAERAKAQADSASKAAADSVKVAQDSIDTARLALEREQARTDSLKKVAEERIAAQNAADSLAAVHQQDREKTSQRLQWAIVSGSAVVILVLLGWFMFARRKRAQLQATASRLGEAEQEAEAARQAAAQAPQSAPFRCLLEGQDNTGQPFALNISALALGAPSGATLGRSPANAEFIIDHESVSREHIKLLYADGNLYVEDLGSTNGTKINGRLLNPREPVVLQNNDKFELGPVVFQVRLMQE